MIRISLSNCHLTRLPLEVVRLRHLQHLSLHYNQVCELPSEIGQLTHLQLLGLSHNQLHEWMRSYYQRMFLSQSPNSEKRST